MCAKRKIKPEDVENRELEKLIEDIFNSPGEYIEKDHLDMLYKIIKKAVFISPSCGAGIIYSSDTTGGLTIPAFTDIEKFNEDFEESHFKPVTWDYIDAIIYLEDERLDGMLVNPGINNFFISRDMIIDAYLE